MPNTPLDFSGLFGDNKQRSKMPVQPLSEGETYKHTSPEENGSTGLSEGLAGVRVNKLIKRAESERDMRLEAQRICKEHQKNTAQSQQVQAEILKGLKAGESVHSLFLKAAKVISIMTNNDLFYDQVDKDLISIYGSGLKEDPALQIELERVQDRLRRLEDAETREADLPVKDRIRRAIKAHRAKAVELERLLAGTDIKNVT